MNPAAPRFASVDALRGSTVAAMLLVNNPGDWGHVYAPLQHAAWHGATPTDLVFPLFLFLVGVSTALAISPRVERGDAPAVLMRAVLVRAARIVLLGLLLHLCAFVLLDQAHFRLWGVLQRIGVCFAAAGLAAIFIAARRQWALFAALVLGHWALLAAGGTLAPFDNVASRVDTALFAPWLYQFDPVTGRGHDPEGLVGTVPAIATTVLGLRAGAWLRAGDVRALVAAGAIALAAGLAWSLVLPLNKNLWTSSYVLWSGGIAMLVLAACHAAIDRRGWPALGRRFGVNAIAAYAGSALMVYVFVALGGWQALYDHAFARWMTPLFGPYVPSLAFAVAFVALWWAIVRWMDRRGIHVRI
ncbi:acyltransferase family protein [Chiayiivirga flava]|uniref:Putative acyltransferase n=1 Tax=Chiayiivirga flava TaxID=659595 RepID=A0A7W8D9R6_9GAMM|nr:heparan-alpha-glucosaminide N-acetyltransferase domain-containing protein [Chiayiivirga flava]MBB5208743.1 putative acyltransferase [Chiayiivirga flava]